MKPLVTDLSTSLEFVGNTLEILLPDYIWNSSDLELPEVEACGVGLLEVMGNASAYTNDFLKNGSTGTGSPASASAIFHDIAVYQRVLGDRLLDFREAAVVQKLIKRGAMRM